MRINFELCTLLNVTKITSNLEVANITIIIVLLKIAQ